MCGNRGRRLERGVRMRKGRNGGGRARMHTPLHPPTQPGPGSYIEPAARERACRYWQLAGRVTSSQSHVTWSWSVVGLFWGCR